MCNSLQFDRTEVQTRKGLAGKANVESQPEVAQIQRNLLLPKSPYLTQSQRYTAKKSPKAELTKLACNCIMTTDVWHETTKQCISRSSAGSVIACNDVVIVYERFDSLSSVTVTTGGMYSNKWGKFAMEKWIGLTYGSKVKSSVGEGWVYLLAPTPELWTLALRHRTQILYAADISNVCMQLELRPGCIVLESGTGSGSLTTSLARAVGPRGHVYTFEFHAQRAELAKSDFEGNGMGGVVTVTHRDIEANGFPEEWHHKADAVFLDLPGPWGVVASAVVCLKDSGNFCSFSPCIEQVQKTAEALTREGCMDIRSIEVLLRDYEIANSRQLTELALHTQEAENRSAVKRLKHDSAQQLHDNDADTSGTKGDVVSRPCGIGKGHTGFLIFARKPPKVC